LDAKPRVAGAVARRAPAVHDAETANAAASGGQRRLVRPAAAPSSAAPAAPAEVLIIASRLKDYVRAKSGYNTSDRVLEPLSEIVRRVCDQAIENARRDGRMTVLDRDIPER
jgi:hypothetical protein